ncbi:DHH family phosphoesterase [Halorubrum sp. F4]|uniref:DHH family phosphoesterase n=1 Tax=Halorubrum sp. F4 TaxID=2989715 RepID=UPI0024813BE0|nr:OB-fold nucleic acid binding domain-containing protein [Halorubrum sp. F4]
MGSCIICGVDVDGGGRICRSHQEDVVFDFRGDSPDGLVANRFYRGVVDGYAEFGVFIDLAPGVTGLLHRSELDRRLDSLEWEPGDDVFVQVKGVRDNGNIDLSWSIRQADREFRGALVQDGETEYVPDEDEGADGGEAENADSDDAGSEDADDDADSEDADAANTPASTEDVAGNERSAASDASEAAGDSDRSSGRSEADTDGTVEAGTTADETPTDETVVEGVADASDASENVRDDVNAESEAESAPDAEYERVDVETLPDRVGETVRLEGEVVSTHQTGGPTIFELRDATGVVDAAAFVEPGVRAYPEVEVGDAIRIDGEVERRRGDIQVETEALVILDGEDAETVRRRLAEALAAKARPEGLQPLAGDGAVAELGEGLLDAAEAVRRAVLESRPIVVRHPATADGYVAGAAVERAVLPLIRDEHAKSDAEYHYFTRRPTEEPVYDMDAATNDVTRMLQDRDRHDEKLPLFLLVGTGSTVESEDGLDLLSVYGVEAVVVDAAVADPETRERVDTLVSPELAEVDDDLSTGALVASLASAVNDEVRSELVHLPAVSYWSDTPDRYVDLARDAGYDRERIAELREAVALEAYYQSYQDKRELIADLLFEDGGDLAAHVSEQFREKLETEIETASANVVSESVDGVEFALLDTDEYTHRFDFPPTPLLLDDLHRRHANGDPFATVGIGTDELYVRSTADLSVREVAARADEIAPAADVATAGLREGKIGFLSGERDAVEDAVVAAIAEQF